MCLRKKKKGDEMVRKGERKKKRRRKEKERERGGEGNQKIYFHPSPPHTHFIF
jgi:hypothetical protein